MIPQRARCKLLGTFSFPARSVSDRQIGGRHRLPNLPERPAGSARRSQSADVRVDHGGLDVGVAEQFLHGADVGAELQQMRGEGVTQRVWLDLFSREVPSSASTHCWLGSRYDPGTSLTRVRIHG